MAGGGAGLIELADDETDQDMYHYMQDQAALKGFHHYEISSFAQPSFECRHNLKYWTQADYVGCGIGGSSAIANQCFSNVTRIADYFILIDSGKSPVAYCEDYSMEDLEYEHIMVNMRLTQGIDIAEFNRRFSTDLLKKYQPAIEKHLRYQTIKVEAGRLFFTPYDMDVENQFYLDLL